MADNAVTWYKLDETVAGPVVDTQGNHNATNNGCDINQTGKFGKCYDFAVDGSGYITIPATLNIGTGTWSIALWFKSTNTVGGSILTAANSASPYPYFDINLEAFARVCSIRTTYYDGTNGVYSQAYNGLVDLTDGNWHLIVVIIDKTTSHTVKVYLDGLDIVSSGYGTEGSIAGASDFTIDGMKLNSFATTIGSIDEVRFYNRVLSQTEINNLMAGNMPSWLITVQVNGGGGTHGTVTKKIGGVINNGPYNYGDQVSLDESPATGNVFVNWTGDLTGSIHPQTITVNKASADYSLSANFTYIEYTLTVIGDTRLATITVNPSQATYHYGDSITLTVTVLSSDNAAFSKWQDANTQSPRTISMPASNYTMTASFKWRRAYVQQFGSAGSGATGSKVYKQCFGTSKPDLVNPADVKTWGASGKEYDETWGAIE